MENLNNNPPDLIAAVAVIEANGASVFQSPVGGQFIVVAPTVGKRDGFTARQIIEMAQNLKPKEPATTSPQ